MDFDNHKWMLEQLEKAREADQDNRNKAQQCHDFVDIPGAQWEEGVLGDDESNKPRYEFDQCNALIDQVYGQMANTDFDVNVRPQSGEATKEVALTYDGLVRNIETVSNARTVYNMAGRNMITCGIDGWEIQYDYVDGDSFEQDLIIKRIPDYINRCWLGPHTEPDGSDAQMGWLLEGLEKEAFKAKFPDRAENATVEGSTDRPHKFLNHHELVMWGHFRYLVPEDRVIVLMSNRKVHDLEQLEDLKDEYESLGVTEVERRTVKQKVMYVRRFDANGWIDDEPVKTVFRNWLNIVPCYAHFKITQEGKVIYWGLVDKVMDPQRVFNYSVSREIEEGALAMRETPVATDAMVAGYEDEWESLLVKAQPYLRYNRDDEAPESKPFMIGGAKINPGLRVLSDGMMGIMQQTAGLYDANMGQGINNQSGVAIDRLQAKGDAGNNIYMDAREISQNHTGRILVDTIPRVYKPGRQQRILNPDGSYEMATIGEEVIDRQTQQPKVLHDLRDGKYDTYVTVSPSFKDRQSQTLAAFESLGQYVPGLIEGNADIIMNNVTAPGLDKAAERARQALLESGAIPEDQQTEEEKQFLAQMQQNAGAEPSPEMALAMAEQGKAEADLINAQTKQFESQANYALEADKLEIERAKVQVEAHKVGAQIEGIEAKALRDLVEAQSTRTKTALEVGSALQPTIGVG